MKKLASARAWRRRARVVFYPEQDLGVADVLQFGRYNYSRAEPGLATHAHERAMEFCYLVRGRQTYRVQGNDYRLVGGDVFLTYPDEPHDTGGAPEEKGVLFWVSLRVPARAGPWLGMPAREAGALRSALLTIKPRHFAGSWRVHDQLETLMEWLIGPADALRTVALHAHLVALLLELTALSRRAHSQPASTSGRRKGGSLEAVARHMETRVAEPLPLAGLAAMAGLSLPRFKVRFRAAYGVPPGEYVLRARVAEARRQLETTARPVTTIAYDLGFSSSQYFATVIKRYTGSTPRELRGIATCR